MLSAVFSLLALLVSLFSALNVKRSLKLASAERARIMRLIGMAEKRCMRAERRFMGEFDSHYIKLKLAEKLADRAFSMASSANVALVAISKAVAIKPPRFSRKEMSADQVLARKVQAITGAELGEWLAPVLSSEELDILEQAKQAYTNNLEEQ